MFYHILYLAFGSFIHPLLNPPRWGGLGRFAPIVGAPNGYGIHMRRRISFAFQVIYITFAISLSVLTKLRQASNPKWMSVFLNCLPGGGSYCEKPIVLTHSQYTINENENKMHIRDNLHQSGDCQACPDQSDCTFTFRQG